MTWNRLPGSTRLLVKASSGRTGRLIRTLAGTSDWRRDIVDRAGVASLLAVGPARLPSAPALEWPAAGLDEVEACLRSELPGLRLIGVATPRQAGRRRLSAVGRMTGGFVVVKLGGADPALVREGEALSVLADHPLPGISTPIPLARGHLTIGDDPVTFLVTTGIELRRQRAAIDEPLRTFEDDLGQRLASLPRPDAVTHADGRDTGGELVPVHGDLTPWNLRRTTRGLALFDWESSGWAAPGTDLAHYRAACDEVRRPWMTRPGSAQRTRLHDPLRAHR